jgi:hypothetical protein
MYWKLFKTPGEPVKLLQATDRSDSEKRQQQ